MRDSRAASEAAGWPAPSAGTDTKERLLDAAERLFADRGFEGASMRAVTQAAGAAVSAANYHFGSKEELLAAVLRRRVEPLNRRRLQLLDALRTQGEGPAALEDVVDAYVRPAIELYAQTAAHADPTLARHVAARLFADPPEIVASLKAELFRTVNERFSEAVSGALPGVSRERCALLLQFTTGMLIHLISGQIDPQLLGALDNGADGTPGDALRCALTRYATAGLRAAAAEEPA